MKRLIFTVTNELVFDQRMIRICSSLAGAGYDVCLVGRCYNNSHKLLQQPFRQVRLQAWFRKGKAFYIEYNIRLFFFLLFQKADLLCAIDLDTILPVLFVSKLKGVHRVYDAHELFCEMKEVVSRPMVYRAWKRVEKFTVPKFQWGYTVNGPIRDIFRDLYGVQYEVIQNIPRLAALQPPPSSPQPIVWYQGAVNEGRSFETLIPAFQWIDKPLWIAGAGNFLNSAKKLTAQYGLEGKIRFLGQLVPEELKQLTPRASIGITLFDAEGQSNYLSLANRFFDYLHAGVPQLCVDYPVYRQINQQYEVAILIADLSAENIAAAINRFFKEEALQQRLKENCLLARKVYNWENEEQKLIQFYRSILD